MGRYQTWLVQEHSKERTWIRDNNPWHLESDSHQKVQSMLSRIQNCLNTRGRNTRYYVVIHSIVIQCCYQLYCWYFCCWCMLFREMLPTISILSQCYKPQIFFLKTNNCSSENTYNVWYLKPYQSIYIAQSIIDNWISIMPYKYDKNKRNNAMTYKFRHQNHVYKTCRGWDINKYAVIISRIYRILCHHICAYWPTYSPNIWHL